MRNYQDFLRHILQVGQPKSDRTGTGTISTFGCQMRFDLQQGFPLVTTKKVHFKSVVHELLFFIRGLTNNNELEKNGVRIWREWARPDGDLGPIYGAQWRSWQGAGPEKIDQLKQVVEQIKSHPESRRHIVSAWNVGELDKMALMPCHVMFQFYVVNGTLSCMLTQRSADAFLGVPFNIASYALLTHMVAKECGLEVGEFIWSGGDCHIYNNHIEQVELQLTREPLPLPRIKLNEDKSLFEYEYEDIILLDYASHPKITAPVSV